MSTVFRPEHPDPRFQRAAWVNLNGPWSFAFDPDLVGEQERWYRSSAKNQTSVFGGRAALKAKPLTINVPFPWESPLSGVCRPDYKGAAWYEREFTVPAAWEGLTPFLNFGAIDWHARVWINGRFVAEHDNGYLPFSVDLSNHLQPGERAIVTVRAYDIAEVTTLVGKQVPWWYTHSSGIWQSVWLEGRAPSHITAIRLEPDVAAQRVTAKLTVQIAQAGDYHIRLRSRDDAFPTVDVQRTLHAGSQPVHFTVAVPAPKLWSPESPHLYEVDLELVPASGGLSDTVASYFGMRTVSRAQWGENEYETILFNGEPVYLRGALDQAFHPESLHAYPSDEIIRGDIQLAKDLGLNMLRCHIKLNDPRYYYWADKLGLLIFYDMPCADLDTPEMRRTMEATVPAAIARDYNSPSIIAWIIFNETWGLTDHDTGESHRWVRKLYLETKKLDPTRLVEDNSPCHYNHVDSDINSWHFYINDYHRVRQHVQRVVDQTYPGSHFNYVGENDLGDTFVQGIAPLMNSEFGGIAARSGDQDIAWCFKYQTTELRRHNKICGYVYTELDDIEWEHNGLVNYDRSPKGFGYDFFVEGMSPADINAADLVGFDAPPVQTLPPGGHFRSPLFVSHWGLPIGAGRVRWQLDLIDSLGERSTITEGEIGMAPTRFAVTDLGELTIPLPEQPGLATVALWLEDEKGTIRSRNYVNIDVRAEVLPLVTETTDGWIVRFAPGNYVDASWPNPFAAPDQGKFSASGRGWVDYTVPLPADFAATAVSRLRVLFEAGARSGGRKIDWPERLYGFNYPQTEPGQETPSDILITINGVEIGTVHLPDDPADARGVLSHYRQIDPGSYGFLREVAVDGATLATILADATTLQIRFTVVGEQANGFALFGETLGGYPVGPTLLFSSQ